MLSAAAERVEGALGALFRSLTTSPTAGARLVCALSDAAGTHIPPGLSSALTAQYLFATVWRLRPTLSLKMAAGAGLVGVSVWADGTDELYFSVAYLTREERALLAAVLCEEHEQSAADEEKPVFFAHHTYTPTVLLWHECALARTSPHVARCVCKSVLLAQCALAVAALPFVVAHVSGCAGELGSAIPLSVVALDVRTGFAAFVAEYAPLPRVDADARFGDEHTRMPWAAALPESEARDMYIQTAARLACTDACLTLGAIADIGARVARLFETQFQ